MKIKREKMNPKNYTVEIGSVLVLEGEKILSSTPNKKTMNLLVVESSDGGYELVNLESCYLERIYYGTLEEMERELNKGITINNFKYTFKKFFSKEQVEIVLYS